jgi:hypothetical protein
MILPVTREIRLNAFEMNCITHQSPGLWRHPRDRAWQQKAPTRGLTNTADFDKAVAAGRWTFS